jgi:hypothetical protein
VGVRENADRDEFGDLHVSNFRTIAAAAALAGAASLAVATSAAQASDTKDATEWCTSSDLAISVVDMRVRPGTEGTKGHMIDFASAEGATCKLWGPLTNVRFLDARGKNMNVSLPDAQGPFAEEVVRDYSHPVVYLGSRSEGPQVYPKYIRFNLPIPGRQGDLVTIPWPSSGLGTDIRLTGIVSPVS